jgi:hypothetical protein
MRTIPAVVVAGIGLMFAVPVTAHHSVAGEFDPDNPVTLTGTVTKLEWTNPHSRLYFDVTDPDGSVTNWNVELAARNVLERMGWNFTSLKVGQKITVTGDQARSGAKMINVRGREQRNVRAGVREYPITLSDGTPVLFDR